MQKTKIGETEKMLALIFVVKTELEKLHALSARALRDLENIRKELELEYNGLTIIPNCLGYWLNDNKQEEKDNVEIWLILSESEDLEETAIIANFTKRIKAITRQKSQFYSINFKPYLV